MAVKTKEEILANLKSKIGEDTSDEALALIEDISDTINDMESKAKDTTDWKTKCEKVEADWRKKYRDRFFSQPSSNDEPDDVPDDDDKPKTLTYDELFKEEK